MEDPMFLEIVTCRDCKNEEHYGMMTWFNGHTVCRKCTYRRWREESGWEPGPKDYIFPVYSDGIDYTKRSNDDV